MAVEPENNGTIVEPDIGSPLDVAIAHQNQSALSLVQDAIRRRTVLLAFQPVVQSRAPQNVAFYESLIRIVDKTGRVIPAKEFIWAAEENEIGRILDCIAVEQGLAALAEEPSLRLSINMSARSIGYPRWINSLQNGLNADPTAAERLVLEITENSAMAIPDIVIPFMKMFQRRGVSFALDDFGAGFTSFRYLREFYFDAIKIDGQFIRGICRNADNQCLTRALLSIADHFDMFTVAECVEDAADAAFLTEMGIDCLQGYHFGIPTTKPTWGDKQNDRLAI